MNKKRIIAIVGPTASGKTAVSLELAKLIEIEIISADSRQIYKYMDIGTAKPTKEEQSLVRHHFIDIINPNEYYSAGIFSSQARNIVDIIFEQGKVPVIVGGSGLYIQALCEGFFEENGKINLEIRKELENRLLINGIEPLFEELLKIDEASANLYNDKNPRRILRALEYYYSTGILFSEAKNSKPEINFETIYFGINFERELLYNRINERSEKMWDDGLLQETENLLEMGFSPDLNALNTVGYKETIEYLNGNISMESAIDEIKKNTRHYAKRQLTWFRKNQKIIWLDGKKDNNARKIAELFEKD